MDPVLAYLREIHPQPWGRVLDAGTGRSSLEWLLELPSESWTAVTAEAGRAGILRERYQTRFRPQDRLLVGNWRDPDFLGEESFTEVLADYLLGSVERYAPYFQVDMLARLARVTTSRLYLVGLEPYRPGEGGELDLIWEIARFRQACHLLAGHPSHREYPLEWTLARLAELRFEVEEVQRFAILYGEELVEGELDGLDQILERLPSSTLRWALRRQLRQLRSQGRRRLKSGRTLPGGFDYLIVARSPSTGYPRLDPQARVSHD